MEKIEKCCEIVQHKSLNLDHVSFESPAVVNDSSHQSTSEPKVESNDGLLEDNVKHQEYPNNWEAIPSNRLLPKNKRAKKRTLKVMKAIEKQAKSSKKEDQQSA